MRTIRILALGLCLGAALAPSRAEAAGDGDLQRYLRAAKRLFQNADNERALEQVQRAKALSRGIQDDVVLALYEGVILADLGRKDDALSAFRAALLLEPEAQLPLRVSPKLRAEVEGVRADVKKELARARAQQEPEVRPAAESADGAPGKQAAESSPAQAPAPAPAAPAAATYPEAPVLAAAPAAAVALPAPEKVAPRKLPWTPIALTAATALVAGTGVLLGQLASQDHRTAQQATWQSDRAQALKSSDQKAVAANALFIAAGALGVGAVVTWVW